jgi:hypothetical protein
MMLLRSASGPALRCRRSDTRRARLCRAAKPKGQSNIPYQSERRKTFDELSTGLCVAPSVLVDNSASGRATKLTVEAVDYPGVLRVIAWVLNGLQVRVQSAQLLSEGDELADTFWLVDLKGNKVRAGKGRRGAGAGGAGAGALAGAAAPPAGPGLLAASLWRRRPDLPPPARPAHPPAARPRAAVRRGRGGRR